jgi:hypothetical protein
MAPPSASSRRRSPAWVRAMPSNELHGIVGRFNLQRAHTDLSEGQEWLWDACISELEYRRRIARPSWRACACMFCFSPFED